jgi:D-alanyl-D-alanine carboxypeptidase
MVRTLSQTMKESMIPGLVILIRSPKGEWVWTLGTAQIGTDKPWSLADHFRIGSNTKTMTGTVILQLAQEGKIALTDPVSNYVLGVPNGDKITIANLAEMRSGLYSYTADAEFNRTLDTEPKKAWKPNELLRIAFAHPVNAAPDTEFEYSNTNTVLLGLIIEKVTGMSASQAFEQRLFAPLGLKQTSLPLADEWRIPDPHPRGYQYLTNFETVDDYAVPKAQLAAALDGSLKPLDFTDSNPSWAWTAGGGISTARDLATYVKAMVGGGLLNPAMQKIRFDSIRDISSGAGYGLGIAKFGPMYGHDGQLPGFSSFMAYDPKTDTALIIGCNLAAEPRNGTNAAVVLAKAVMGVLYGPGAVTAGDPAHTGKTSAEGEAK